ncbi:MAG: hypothetical protein ACJAYX_003334 [Planctomycetota bacterium]|jgi:hypothetical protein
MRFFTMDWWHGVQDGSAEDPFEAYEHHMASLRPFPPAVAALDDVPSLHDAHMVRIDHADGSVELTLHTWNSEGCIPIWLSYGRVVAFSLDADTERSLPGPLGFGDLGYCEVDTHSEGMFEHRMLFSSGFELSVRFREFTLRVGAVQLDNAADDASHRS